MWAHTAVTVIHVAGHLLVAGDDNSGSGGGGGSSNGVIITLMTVSGGIVVAYLTTRRRNRDERQGELDNAESMGGIKQQVKDLRADVTQLEADREIEKDAREVMDAHIAENTHRIEQLEEVNRIVPIPPSHPVRHRKPPPKP